MPASAFVLTLGALLLAGFGTLLVVGGGPHPGLPARLRVVLGLWAAAFESDAEALEIVPGLD